jgi:phage shock protein A
MVKADSEHEIYKKNNMENRRTREEKEEYKSFSELEKLRQSYRHLDNMINDLETRIEKLEASYAKSSGRRRV